MSENHKRGGRRFFRPDTRWRPVALFVFLVAVASVAYAYIMVTLYRNESDENLRVFSEKQQLQTRFAADAIEARLHAVMYECRVLSSYSIPYFLAGRRPATDMTERLDIAVRTYPGLAGLSYVDLSGGIFHASTPTRRGERGFAIAQSQVALYGGRNLLHDISAPFVPPVFSSSDTQLIVMLFPVFSGETLCGTLAAVFDLREIVDQIVSSLRFGLYGTAFLTDGYGTLLYHPNSSLVGKNVFEGLFVTDESFVEFNRWQMEEARGTGRYNALFRTGEPGEAFSPKIAAWESIRLGNVNLTVTMSTFVEEVEAPTRNLRFRLQLTGALFMLLLLTMTVLAVRRTDDQRVRENEIRLRLGMEAAGDSFWDWNLRSGNVVYSDNWGKMFGFSPEQIAPSVDVWRSGIHPDDAAMVKEILDGHLRRGTPYVVEYRFRNAYGRYQWVLTRGEVVDRDRNGSPVRMIGTNADIDRRKHMEAELREKNEAVEAYAVRQRVLFRIFTSFARCRSSGELYATLEESLRDAFEYFSLLLVVRESRRTDAFTVHDSKKRPEVYGQASLLRDGLGIVGRAFRAGRVERVGDVTVDPDYVPHDPAIRSMLIVPVSSRDVAWGVIALDSEKENAFGERDEELLSIVASYVALHLEERDAHGQLDRKALQLQSLHELVQLVMTERDNAAVARDVTDVLVSDFGFSYASMLADAENRADEPVGAGRSGTPDDLALARTALDSRSVATRSGPKGETQAVSLPIAFGDRFYGILSVAGDTGISEEDLKLLFILADHISKFWALNEFILARQKEAWEDPLTGVWNRRFMIRKLEEEDRRMNRYGGRSGVAIVDLGNFKRVNDLLGHSTGDDVLVTVARILVRALRETDFVGRYGGDEFIVYMPDSTMEQCRVGLERAAKAVSELEIPGADSFRVYADYGAACRPEDGESLLALINTADGRMYEYKIARKRECGASFDDMWR